MRSAALLMLLVISLAFAAPLAGGSLVVKQQAPHLSYPGYPQLQCTYVFDKVETQLRCEVEGPLTSAESLKIRAQGARVHAVLYDVVNEPFVIQHASVDCSSVCAFPLNGIVTTSKARLVVLVDSLGAGGFAAVSVEFGRALP